MQTLSPLTSLCRRFARLLSFAVSVYGLLPFLSADFRSDAVVMSLYCILPVLSFPVTLVSFQSMRLSVMLHWLLAFGYLAVYSMLDWRTCAQLGYCQGVMATVLVTTTSWRVRGLFLVAILNLALLVLELNSQRGEVKSMQAAR